MEVNNLKRNILASQSLKSLITLYERSLNKVKNQYWQIIMDSKKDDSIALILEVNPKDLLKEKQIEFNNVKNNIKKLNYKRNNILASCTHDLVIIIDDEYALCPICSRYLNINDVPNALILDEVDFLVTEEMLDKVRAKICALITKNPFISLEDIKKEISPKIIHLENDQRKRVKNESKKNSHAFMCGNSRKM